MATTKKRSLEVDRAAAKKARPAIDKAWSWSALEEREVRLLFDVDSLPSPESSKAVLAEMIERCDGETKAFFVEQVPLANEQVALDDTLLWNAYLATHADAAALAARGDEVITFPNRGLCGAPFETKANFEASGMFRMWKFEGSNRSELIASRGSELARLADVDRRLATAMERWKQAAHRARAARHLLETGTLSTVSIARSPEIESALEAIDAMLANKCKSVLFPIGDARIYVVSNGDSLELRAGLKTGNYGAAELRGSRRFAVRSDAVDTKLFVEALGQFAADPAGYVERACVLVGQCCVCGRGLTKSKDQGIGPVCRKRIFAAAHCRGEEEGEEGREGEEEGNARLNLPF